MYVNTECTISGQLRTCTFVNFLCPMDLKNLPTAEIIFLGVSHIMASIFPPIYPATRERERERVGEGGGGQKEIERMPVCVCAW